MHEKIELHRQSTCEGCLPVCLLSLINEKVTLESEIELLIGGFKRSRESYAQGIISEFAERYKNKLTITIHNKHYYKKLISFRKNPMITLIHKKIDMGLLKKLSTPFILNLDDRILRKSVHYPHFVIVERKLRRRYVLIDPWNGRRKWLSERKLYKGILSLKNYLKFCPLIIKLD